MTVPTRAEIEAHVDQKMRELHARLLHADRDERKEALKEAFKEIMQEHLARLGGWTLTTVAIFIAGSLIYLALYIVALKTGWTPPPK